MSGIDKLKNSIQETKGEAKEHMGRATGNESMEAEGKGDQVAGGLKQAGEKVKDAFR